MISGMRFDFNPEIELDVENMPSECTNTTFLQTYEHERKAH